MGQSKSKKIIFSEPVADIIKRRKSVRTYEEGGLKPEDREKLINCFDSLEGPFGFKIRYMYLERDAVVEESGEKIGTYGIIKGTESYIAPVICHIDSSDEGFAKKIGKAIVELGYCFEQLVLYATSLGIGTCWLGGTFSRTSFAKAVGLTGNEILTIVSPVGYPAVKKSLVEKIMYKGAGSKNRMNWTELFFDKVFEKTLHSENAGVYKLPLEMVRLAPSASNKQPWRVVKDGVHYHFYLKKAPGYSKLPGFDIQKVDMGIAMCHFELTAAEAGLKGIWEDTGGIGSVGDKGKGMEYITSWKCTV